ncbi:MAG: 3-oxoacyl-ACP reductase FabG [Flavobacteriaceae bacterium]|jgi:3-oxoacyl-[acyl-carrier protein] reductase|nr:3-oxoacyl-ACP reductase FabG [Pelagibacterales bacterium]MBT4958595.1 3-oxoacyl-ACP reductase FabG [Flavobacteriaceae bacterium]MBT6353217.1 3-oxoacyl-ACP reductase FabG [Pelagibacteraceae bacterium]MBT6170554.1 3-oxoacyl-ACP reductase FabG [Flavobacteriaceae bacterium]MBT7623679.1 3-oxoacyl-ACP reductase FabG [Flavobacteriaceae bacterium]|tara:strand:- start:813 stop:1553 length:741 start_codon:yes stop_codon:yes gene_type:complete
MKRLEGQVAIVTGGARGIGKGICEVFCREGATVALWDVLDGTDTVNEITKNGGNIFYQKVDVTDQECVNEAVEKIIKDHGKIEILINNAGIIRDKSFLKMSEDDWDSVINVNLKSLYVVTRTVVPYMKANGYGRIVSASSINGTAGAFGQTNYCATKAGISGFTRALCKEVGKHGITANAVAPGFVKSVMSDSMPEEIIKGAIKMIPVGRIGTPEDMGHAYLFLASKESGFVSGITLHANGGAMPM